MYIFRIQIICFEIEIITKDIYLEMFYNYVIVFRERVILYAKLLTIQHDLY